MSGVVNRGELYWIGDASTGGAIPPIAHPHVVGLSAERVDQVLTGLRFQQASTARR